MSFSSNLTRHAEMNKEKKYLRERVAMLKKRLIQDNDSRLKSLFIQHYESSSYSLVTKQRRQFKAAETSFIAFAVSLRRVFDKKELQDDELRPKFADSFRRLHNSWTIEKTSESFTQLNDSSSYSFSTEQRRQFKIAETSFVAFAIAL